MKTTFLFSALFLALLLNAANSEWCPTYKVKVFTATAASSADLDSTITRYRSALGGVDNGNNPGPLPTGHRSINWDADIVPFNMPGNFFKVTVPRGAEFHTADRKFAVSNPPRSDPPHVIDNRFSSFNPAFPMLFRTFSPKRLFTSVNSNELKGLFSVPVDGSKATVTGFGAIFTNVVRKKKTAISFFDRNGCLINKLAAPQRAKGLSFAGIIVVDSWGMPVSKIETVKVNLGTAAISSPYYHWKNFVVMDDLIYGEPQAI